MAKSIMVQGTMSDAGKSVVATALCRIFAQDGYTVAPFKAQNMALNSYITRDGLEMGRAQVVQAEAAGIEPSVLMNPILLKPTSNVGSQVIVKGEVRGDMDARTYHRSKADLVPVVQEAYDELARSVDIVVIEGAGSPAEINLNKDDLVNMGMSRMAAAPVLLVGNIDVGGVFAQLYGTVELVDAADRTRIKGLIINKFRGDVSILEPGLQQLEDICRVPVVGVIHHIDVDIEPEDSMDLRQMPSTEKLPDALDVAVIRLPRISNFTDMAALAADPRVSVRYVDDLHTLGVPALIILPGTKSTMDDLRWMRTSGMEGAVLKLAGTGVPVVGICGGYQILGEQLRDPFGCEGGGDMAGMGLLPITTIFSQDKTRTRVNGTVTEVSGCLSGISGKLVEGYEIHMGRTSLRSGRPFLKLDTGALDGCVVGNVYGTYLHGIFDSDDLREALLQSLGAPVSGGMDRKAYKEANYDKLADHVRAALDMDMIYKILEEGV